MSLNRITSGLMSNQSIHALSLNMGILSKIQQKMSSGKNILNPSDDPVGLTRVVDLSNQLRTDERYSRNIQDALSEVTTTDKVMTSIVELVQRAQELATQAANVSHNQDGRTAIALEIDQIINQLVQFGNTNVNGKMIFGGMITTTDLAPFLPPYTRGTTPGVDDNEVTYNGTPSAGNWQRNVEIGQGIEITINVNGDDLLGHVAITPGNTIDPGNSQGLFLTLMQLKEDLLGNDITGIRDSLDTLDTDLNSVLAQQAVIGSVMNRLELTQGRIEERKAILTQQYASIQDIDMPKTIADLNHQQNILEASLGVTARLMQTTLLDFLR